MKRQIKFRGKRIDNGCWVYGSLIKMDGSGYQSFIFPFYKSASSMTCGQIVAYGMVGVDIETVGQFTGLYDQNGKEVYEGDIVEGTMGKLLIFYGEIVGDGYGFQWKPLANSQWESFTGFIDEYEIIGNIHDNPELLERESDYLWK